MFEQYIQELGGKFEDLDWLKFTANLLLTALLAGLLSVFYIKFGNSLSNRRRFARNFLPLALTTMLIISIVKSSVALSLGLVGALSIVRFRSAIKDPEELTYLFFTIGIGLAIGANQPAIAVVAFVVILAFLFIQALIQGKNIFPTTENMHVNINTKNKDLKAVTKILESSFSFVELKRMDETAQEMALSFIVEAEDINEIESAKKQILEMDPESTVSFVEQRSIAV